MKDEKKIENERCNAKQERAKMEEGIKAEQCDILGRVERVKNYKEKQV